MNKTGSWVRGLTIAGAAFSLATANSEKDARATADAASVDRLRAAEQFSSAAVRGLLYGDAAIGEQGQNVPSAIVEPRWIGDEGQFWYEFRDRSGYRYVFVESSAAARRPLFDHDKLAAKLQAALERPFSWRSDKLGRLTVDRSGRRLTFVLDGRTFGYDRETGALRSIVLPAQQLNAGEYSISPDGRYAALVRGHDLYIRDLESGTERRLTDDGERWHSFARDYGSRDSQKPLAGHLLWLPGSRRFVVERWDNRQVGDIQITDWTAAKRAVTRTTKFAMPGDDELPVQELWVFDAQAATAVQVETARWRGQFVGHMDLDTHGIAASPTGDSVFYFTRMKRGYDVIELLAASTDDGTARVILRDANEPYLTIRRPAYAVLDDESVVWLSDRSGWNHFYLHDSQSGHDEPVTTGRYVAERIAYLDRDEHQLYFSAFGREPGLPPYLRQYYRVALDGGEPLRLTPEDAIHEAQFSPQGNYFVDNYSHANAAPVAKLRDRKGALVLKLERLDTTALERAGFRAPEPFSVKAADGKTALYGVMWKPSDFDPQKRYPLISIVQPNPGHSGLRYRYDPDNIAVSLAQLGAIVVEARTRGQGRHVRNREHVLHSYGNPRDYPLNDARATVRQLVERHAYIDGSRVGIYGHSGGGFMAASLMLTWPDLYDVAVSASGNHENESAEWNSGEYHWGVTYDPADDSWSADFPGNAKLAERLRGRLLLLHGVTDLDTHVGHTMQVAQALQQAGKRFDMMLFPAEDHALAGVEDYYQRLVRAYFAEHLLGLPTADADFGKLATEPD